LALAHLLLAVQTAAAVAELGYARIHSLSLTNGLVALLVEAHDSPVVTVQVWYHVGSKDDPAGKTGFAHLMEHLMFAGTKNVGPEQFADYVVRSGGATNAYTTEDCTVFWETVPRTHLPLVLWLEADRMRNLEITPQVFQTEKEVVKEERRQRLDNRPYGTVLETLYRHAFTVHPYGHLGIGSLESLNDAHVDDIRVFYDRYYVPNNATLIVVGDFDTPAVESLIRQYFGPISPGPHSFERRIPPEPPQDSVRVVKLTLDVSLPAFVRGYRMPADGTDDAYPLRLAAKILSEGESSRIYRRLVYEKQLALQAESAGNFTEHPNLFFVFAIMNPGVAPAAGQAEIDAELERLKCEPVPAGELTKAKQQILRDFVLTRDTSRSLGEELGYAAVVLKDPELLNTELDRFWAVTAEDIQRVARRYFVPNNLTVVEVHPRMNEAEGTSRPTMSMGE